MEFKAGQVVQLVSGGVPMAVEAVGVEGDQIDGGFDIGFISSDDVVCVWQEGKKTHREVFKKATLIPYKAPVAVIRGLSQSRRGF